MDDLFLHQKQGVTLGLTNQRYAFFYDTGTGKTRMGLELHRSLGSRRTLVVCPLSIIEPAWGEEIARWIYPKDRNVTLYNLHRERQKLKSGISPFPSNSLAHRPGAVAAINYESFRLLWKELLKYEWDVVIFDESSYLKTFNSKVTKAAIRFADSLRKRPTGQETSPRIYLMSGSPAPTSELQYWGQLRVLGERFLGQSFYSYRNKYFQQGGYMGYEWKITKPMKARLMQQIGKVACFVDKADCLDLPPQLDETIHCELTPRQQRAYKTMAQELAFEMEEGDWALAGNALAKILRLRQITSGFLYPQVRKEEDPAAVTLEEPQWLGVEWLGEGKLKALNDLLESTQPHQMIIWVTFRLEARRVEEVCSKFGATETLLGNTKVKDRPGVIKRFQSGETRYLVAHPGVAGHGLTFTNCHYAAYFSLSHNSEHYKQSRDRLHRAGQKNPCTYFHFVAPRTIDEDLLKALRTKRKVELVVLQGLKKYRHNERHDRWHLLTS